MEKYYLLEDNEGIICTRIILQTMDKLDELKIAHQKVMDFTFNCDNKASFLGAVIGIMVTAVASAGPFWQIVKELINSARLFWSDESNVIFDWQSFIMGFCLVVSACTLMAAVVLILLVLLPRLGKPYGNSRIYFGSIGGMSKEQYTDYIQKEDDDSISEDYLSQIHICSQVCLKKFLYFRHAVKLTVFSIGAFALFAIVVLIFKSI